MAADKPTGDPAIPREENSTVSRVIDPANVAGAALLRPGVQVGHYRIMEQIGEGGFAIVYLAEQDRPVRRQVALKIIKLGMDTKDVLARFESERQALALMDHVNVAKVLDAGQTQGGRPYIVMEYVAGSPITVHCDHNRLTLAERLGLFTQLCEGVQHAHQKAIIHRDIKPSNVLVANQSGKPIPKVIDFGVAKAIAHRLTNNTIFTVHGQLIGTPVYMSPEQAEMSGVNADTRTDVYSLGVLLYELLTGMLPFDREAFRAASFDEIQRILRKEEIPRPSVRLSSADERAAAFARDRRTDPRALLRDLRGDLDWIALKALEKEPSRRYSTPKALAEDIERYLTGQAVLATPPSLTYRTGKFVRRHAVAVAAAAASVVVLIVFAGAMVVHARRIAAERDVARRAQAELAKVVQFQARQLSGIEAELMGVQLRRDLLAQARRAMERSGLDDARLGERISTLSRLLAGTNFTDLALTTLDANIFATARTAVAEQFDDQPVIKARLLQTLADTARKTGLFDTAAAAQEDALSIRRRVLGEDHPDTLTSTDRLGLLMQHRGKLAEAEGYLREALDGRRSVLGDDDVDTLTSVNHLGLLLYDQGKLEEAEALMREALNGARRVLGDDHPQTLKAVRNMGRLLKEHGKLAEAEPYYRQALAGARRVLGDEHPDTLEAMNNMGYLLYAMGRHSEVEPYYREVLAASRRVLGNSHPSTLLSLNNLGFLLKTQGKLSEAQRYFEEALQGRRRVFGDDHPDTLISANNMGFLLQAQKKHAEAEPYYREALDGFRRVLGREHPTTLASINNLACLQNERSRYSETEGLLRGSLPIHIKVLGPDHWRTAEARSLLGEALRGMRQYEAAEGHLLEGYKGLEASLPAGRRAEKLPPAARRLVDLYVAWGKPKAAAGWRAKLPTKGAPSAR